MNTVAKSNVVAFPATKKAPKNTKRQPAAFGVVGQVQQAMRPDARMATVVGFLLGGFVPAASFVVAHYEIDRATAVWSQLATYLVLGGLVYSAKTVYAWGCMAFRMPLKAAGFVVLVEGVMMTSTHAWLSFAALAYLVVINGIATGCALSVRAPKQADAAE